MRKLLYLLAFLPAFAFGQTANLWIDTDGGTCTRSASPAAYSNAAACSSISAALTAASAGDTVIMKTGSYGSQTINVTKSSPGVTVRCEVTQAASPNSCTIGVSGGSVTTKGAWYTLQDITFNPGDARGGGWEARCSNCTFKNWRVHGDFVGIAWLAEQPGDVTNIVWDGGELFEEGNTSGTRKKSPNGTCTDSEDPQPFWIGAFNSTDNYFGNGTLSGTIRGVTFRGSYVDASQFCAGDNLHLDRVRVDGRVTLTIENSIFTNDGNENTASLFYSNFLGGPPTLIVRNTYLGGTGQAGFQNNSGGDCTGVTFLYSTLEAPQTYTPSSCENGVTYRYNAMASATCAGTHVGNFIYGTSCAGDTQKTGANFRTAMGLGSSGYDVQIGSSLIDAGQATCATYASSEDVRGYARPSGSACDVGAYEYGASGSSGPPAPGRIRIIGWLF